MSDLLKTTVYLDREAYARLKHLARAEGRKPAELVREAVSEYTARHQAQRLPRSLGAGRSGVADLAERVDELLAGMGSDG